MARKLTEPDSEKHSERTHPGTCHLGIRSTNGERNEISTSYLMDQNLPAHGDLAPSLLVFRPSWRFLIPSLSLKAAIKLWRRFLLSTSSKICQR